jgi:hypothetical protein
MSDLTGQVRQFYLAHDQMMRLRAQDEISRRDWEHITDLLEDIACVAHDIISTTWPQDTVPATESGTLRTPQIDEAAAIVAAWLGERMGLDEPAPIGQEFAYRGQGPMLVYDYEGLWYPQKPTPALILEGGPDDWAVYAAEECRENLTEIGVFSEPLASFILQFYPLPTSQVPG